MRNIGVLIDHMRTGGAAPLRHANAYLDEALHLSEVLLSTNSLKS